MTALFALVGLFFILRGLILIGKAFKGGHGSHTIKTTRYTEEGSEVETKTRKW